MNTPTSTPPNTAPPPAGPPPGGAKAGWNAGRVVAATYAITVEDIDLGSDPVDFVPKDVLGRVRIRAERPGGGPVFVGIGPEREVNAYLRGVAHAEVDDFDPPRYLTSRGGAPRRPPSAEQCWVASAQGSGRQAVSWEVEGGRWSVVAMNADGARRVVLDADVAAKAAGSWASASDYSLRASCSWPAGSC